MLDQATVLCPLSGKGSDERAIPIAAGVAERSSALLVLFSAVEDSHLVAAQRTYLDRQVATATAAASGVQVVTEAVRQPHPPDAIIAAVTDDTLVVMATSPGPFSHPGYLGSAAEKVVRESHRPTMLVGPNVKEVDGFAPKRVLVPCDGSRIAEEALPLAQQWSNLLDVPTWVIGVDSDTNPAHLPDIHALAAEQGAQGEVLHHHDPAVAIAAAAGTDSLIVMTSNGRSGLRRLALGSVAAGTARRALSPVLVLNPAK